MGVSFRSLPLPSIQSRDRTARRMPAAVLGCLFLATLLAAPGLLASAQDDPAPAQEQGNARERARERGRELFRRSRANPFVRNDDAVLTVFEDVVADASASTVKIMDDRTMLAFGTAISADGFLVTKASELTSNFTCELHDGTRVPAEVIGIHVSEDVALLKISGHELIPAEWDAEAEPEVGSWIVSVGQTTTPLAVGVVSVKARPISPPEGVMGVYLDDANPGALITNVIPESPADTAGLKTNDVVTSVNGESVEDRPSLQAIVKKKRPGDIIELGVQRDEEELKLHLELGNRQELDPLNQRSLQQNELGGPLSGVREGFSMAIQHDSGINSNECGGPVVGLSGRPVGLNIARAGRVNSYVLPASVLVPLIEELKSGRFAPAVVNKQRIAKLDEEIALLQKTIADDLEPSIKKLESEVETATAELQSIKDKAAGGKELSEDDQQRLDEIEEQRQDIKKKLLPAQSRLRRLEDEIRELKRDRQFLATGLRD